MSRLCAKPVACIINTAAAATSIVLMFISSFLHRPLGRVHVRVEIQPETLGLLPASLEAWWDGSTETTEPARARCSQPQATGRGATLSRGAARLAVCCQRSCASE